MAYNGMFAGEWMPTGPAGGATSSSTQGQQRRTMTRQYSHITSIIDMTRTWREYSFTHLDDDNRQPVVSKYLSDGTI